MFLPLVPLFAFALEVVISHILTLLPTRSVRVYKNRFVPAPGCRFIMTNEGKFYITHPRFHGELKIEQIGLFARMTYVTSSGLAPQGRRVFAIVPDTSNVKFSSFPAYFLRSKSWKPKTRYATGSQVPVAPRVNCTPTFVRSLENQSVPSFAPVSFYAEDAALAPSRAHKKPTAKKGKFAKSYVPPTLKKGVEKFTQRTSVLDSVGLTEAQLDDFSRWTKDDVVQAPVIHPLLLDYAALCKLHTCEEAKDLLVKSILLRRNKSSAHNSMTVITRIPTRKIKVASMLFKKHVARNIVTVTPAFMERFYPSSVHPEGLVGCWDYVKGFFKGACCALKATNFIADVGDFFSRILDKIANISKDVKQWLDKNPRLKSMLISAGIIVGTFVLLYITVKVVGPSVMRQVFLAAVSLSSVAVLGYTLLKIIEGPDSRIYQESEGHVKESLGEAAKVLRVPNDDAASTHFWHSIRNLSGVNGVMALGERIAKYANLLFEWAYELIHGYPFAARDDPVAVHEYKTLLTEYDALIADDHDPKIRSTTSFYSRVDDYYARLTQWLAKRRVTHEVLAARLDSRLTTITAFRTRTTFERSQKNRAPPLAILLIGPSGTGKSTLAKECIAQCVAASHPAGTDPNDMFAIMNASDKYFSTYNLQEFVLMEELASSLSEDVNAATTLNVLNYISPNPTNVIKADVAEKGMPMVATRFFGTMMATMTGDKIKFSYKLLNTTTPYAFFRRWHIFYLQRKATGDMHVLPITVDSGRGGDPVLRRARDPTNSDLYHKGFSAEEFVQQVKLLHMKGSVDSKPPVFKYTDSPTVLDPCFNISGRVYTEPEPSDVKEKRSIKKEGNPINPPVSDSDDDSDVDTLTPPPSSTSSCVTVPLDSTTRESSRSTSSPSEAETAPRPLAELEEEENLPPNRAAQTSTNSEYETAALLVGERVMYWYKYTCGIDQNMIDLQAVRYNQDLIREIYNTFKSKHVRFNHAKIGLDVGLSLAPLMFYRPKKVSFEEFLQALPQECPSIVSDRYTLCSSIDRGKGPHVRSSRRNSWSHTNPFHNSSVDIDPFFSEYSNPRKAIRYLDVHGPRNAPEGIYRYEGSRFVKESTTLFLKDGPEFLIPPHNNFPVLYDPLGSPYLLWDGSYYRVDRRFDEHPYAYLLTPLVTAACIAVSAVLFIWLSSVYVYKESTPYEFEAVKPRKGNLAVNLNIPTAEEMHARTISKQGDLTAPTMAKLRKNMVQIIAQYGDWNGCKSVATFFSARSCVMTCHGIKSTSGELPDSLTILVNGEPKYFYRFEKVRCHYNEVEDYALLTFPSFDEVGTHMNDWADITNLFYDATTNYAFDSGSVFFKASNNELVPTTFSKLRFYPKPGPPLEYDLSCATANGHSGCPLVCEGPGIGVIVGLHTGRVTYAKYITNTGAGCVIPRELLLNWLQIDCVTKESVIEVGAISVTRGVMGSHLPTKSKLVPTPLQKTFPPTKFPAAMRAYTYKGEVISPLLQHFKKSLVHDRFVGSTNYLAHIVTPLFPQEKPADMLLTLHQAINGYGMMSRMDMTGSPGFPYTLSKLPPVFEWLLDDPEYSRCERKADLFHFDGENYHLKDFAKKVVIQQLMDTNLQVYIAFPKDEILKPIEMTADEVRVKDTRYVYTAPLSVLLVERMTFGSFVAQMGKEPHKSMSAVGINAHSRQWAELFARLSKHKRAIDLDFASMDITVRNESWDFFINAYCLWLGIGVEAFRSLVAANIQKELNFSPQETTLAPIFRPLHVRILYGDILIECIRNCSGTYNTAIKNLAALLEGIALAIVTLPRETYNIVMADLRSHLELTTYGDDFALSYSDLLKDVFAGPALAKVYYALGYLATDARKSATIPDYISPAELQFIKRRFVPRNGWVFAPLDESSIYNSLLWRFKTRPLYQFFDDAFRSFEIECAHYPDFQKRVDSMVEAMKTIGYAAKPTPLFAIHAKWQQ